LLTLLNLGSDVKKIQPLLDTLNKLQIRVKYYALDLSREVLVDSMKRLCQRYRTVKCFGLWGTFDDCLQWVQKSDSSPKCYISLGSMFGNDHFNTAVARLKSWTDIMRPQDRMLLGLDGTSNRHTIWNSYHDDEGLFHTFIRNGLAHSNAVLGHDWYQPQDWDITGEFQDQPLMHHFVIRAVHDVEYKPLGLSFRRGEQVICYEGFKYGPAAMQKQFKAAGLKQKKQWQSPSGRICKSYSLGFKLFGRTMSSCLHSTAFCGRPKGMSLAQRRRNQRWAGRVVPPGVHQGTSGWYPLRARGVRP